MWPTEDMMAGSPTPPFDVLVAGITTKDLHSSISDALGCSYLAAAPAAEMWPVKGICYGVHRRSMVTMPVSFRGSCVNVHFLFDTGSPCTYMSSEALKAVGWNDTLSDCPLINNVAVWNFVLCSDLGWQDQTTGEMHEYHFKGINMLGMDFLHRSMATFTLNCADGPLFAQHPAS
jgi:hypothetical protein